MNVNIQQLLTALELHDAGDWENVQRHVRKLLLHNHPDVHTENKIYYEEKTKKILRAYEFLKKMVSEGEPLPGMPPAPDIAPDMFPPAFLLFQIKQRTFAFPVQNVKEVTRAENVDKNSLFSGKTRIRGEEVPLFSLSLLLSLTEIQPPLFETLPGAVSRVIVLVHEKKKAGFLVDSVQDVVELPDSEFVTPAYQTPLFQKYIDRMAVKDERLISILSPEKIFQALE